jgi:hypothetical protein
VLVSGAAGTRSTSFRQAWESAPRYWWRTLRSAMGASGRVEDFDHDQIDRALDVNLRAPI